MAGWLPPGYHLSGRFTSLTIRKHPGIELGTYVGQSLGHRLGTLLSHSVVGLLPRSRVQLDLGDPCQRLAHVSHPQELRAFSTASTSR